MHNFAVTQNFKIGSDSTINIGSSGDLFRGFGCCYYCLSLSLSLSPSLSYNLFALMRQLLPLEFANKRAKYIRYRLYAIAAKVIKTGRKVIIKCQAQ
jgi:hypothetical protein